MTKSSSKSVPPNNSTSSSFVGIKNLSYSYLSVSGFIGHNTLICIVSNIVFLIALINFSFFSTGLSFPLKVTNLTFSIKAPLYLTSIQYTLFELLIHTVILLPYEPPHFSDTFKSGISSVTPSTDTL